MPIGTCKHGARQLGLKWCRNIFHHLKRSEDKQNIGKIVIGSGTCRLACLSLPPKRHRLYFIALPYTELLIRPSTLTGCKPYHEERPPARPSSSPRLLRLRQGPPYHPWGRTRSQTWDATPVLLSCRQFWRRNEPNWILDDFRHV